MNNKITTLLSSCLLFVLSACSDRLAQSDQIPASTEQISIYRDAYGTPHVVAQSNYGVYFGYGYVVASDRMFQMEMLRRTVRGQVAEVLGRDYLELDKHVRTAYDHRAIIEQLKSLNPQDKEILIAYANGFNKRVNETLADPQTLPKEFVDYDFLPQRWSVEDVAMIFVGSIIHRYSDFNSELDNQGLIQSLSQRHKPQTAQKIFNASKWLLDATSPVTAPETSTAYQRQAPVNKPLPLNSFTTRIVLQNDGKFLGTNKQPQLRNYQLQQLADQGFTGPEYAAASNFWSLNSSRLSDADGALVNGPQFGFGVPSYVYGIGLHGGDFNVVGNTLLGLPTLLFAHNNQVAWGSTAGISDQVDVYAEQLVAEKPEHYRHNGKDKPFEIWTETIKLKNAEPVYVKARRSVHGMVVSIDAENGIAYSRARAWEGAELKTMMAWVNMAKDRNLDQVQSRLSDVAANINFYYMDVNGNIAYTHGGRYPQRRDHHDPRVPARGTGEDDWLGYRPYGDNPTTRNPEQGYIANWNNRPGRGWLASDLWIYTWSKADRNWHIIEEIETSPRLSTDQVWQIAENVSYDDVSAVFLFPYLQKAMAGQVLDDDVAAAWQRLENWDAQWRLHDNGAYGAEELIVESWTKHLFESVLLDDVGKDNFALYSATNNPNHSLGPSMPSSVGVKIILRNLQLLGTDDLDYDFFNGLNPQLLLRQSFIETISKLIETHGRDMSIWSLAPAKMTWRPYNFRGVPQASPETKVTLPAYMNRGSENNFFIAKNGAFTAYDVIPPGQSGFVAANGEQSPHFKDQMELYAQYQLKVVPFTLDELKQLATSHEALTINPGQSHVDNIQRVLDKAEQFKHLRAMTFVDHQGALAAAKETDKGLRSGVLSGLPVVVKDNIHVAGMPNTAGTPALKNFVPDKNNASVQRLIDAGAIVIGKTNMHELAFGITSNNAAFGAVRNAHNPQRIAGGSSGGSAVAIAAGIVDMGLGTDTGGSARIPPALNGVVGFRPTQGRYPGGGVTPISSTRDTVGPIANNVSNTALLDCVITHCDDSLIATDLPGLRLGVPRDLFYENLSNDVARVTQNLLGKLDRAGVQLIELDLPGLQAANASASLPVALYEFMQELPLYLEEHNIDLSMSDLSSQIASADVKAIVNSQLGEQAVPETAYRAAMDDFRPQLRMIYEQAFKRHNIAALIVPTTPLTATPIASSDETVMLQGEQLPTFTTFIRNTDPASNAGLPSLTLPVGRDSQRMPIGIMLDGPANSDRKLLSIGLAIEKLLAN